MIMNKETQIRDESVVAGERLNISRIFSATFSGGTCEKFAVPVDYQSIQLSLLKVQFPSGFVDNLGIAFYDQQVQPNAAALELINRWLAEDPVVEDDQEFEQLKCSVNEHRLSERKRF